MLDCALISSNRKIFVCGFFIVCCVCDKMCDLWLLCLVRNSLLFLCWIYFCFLCECVGYCVWLCCDVCDEFECDYVILWCLLCFYVVSFWICYWCYDLYLISMIFFGWMLIFDWFCRCGIDSYVFCVFVFIICVLDCFCVLFFLCIVFLSRW